MIRKRYQWKLKDREIELGERTLIMGVLNVTPDSFSDGGRHLDPDLAYARALQIEEEGADIIDIGAESTHPGSKRLNEEEELKRLIPVLRKLAGRLTIPISVDTYKSGVAARALELGAEIINDPSALTFDPALPKTVLRYDAGFVLNHMRGTPETWAKLPPLPDVVGSVMQDLEASVRKCQLARIPNHRLVLDPGIGFGKRGEQNAELLAKLGVLSNLGFPLLVGPSRKSFLNQTTDEGRLMGTAAAVAAAIMMGAHIVRVHDVWQMRAVVSTADSILRASARLPRREHQEQPEKRRQAKPPPRQSGEARREASDAGSVDKRGSRAGRPQDGESGFRKPGKRGRPFRRRDDRPGSGPGGRRHPRSPRSTSRPPKSPPEESGE
jgi:dihydropteroate synthase